MGLNTDINWRNQLVSILRDLTLVEQKDVPGDLQSEYKKAVNELTELFQQKVDEIKLSMKEEMADICADALYESLKADEISNNVIGEFGDELREFASTESYDNKLEGTKALIQLGKHSTPLFSNTVGQSRTYYLIKFKENDRDTIVWPGSGRFSEDLRKVFYSDTFACYGGGEGGQKRPKDVLDSEKVITGEDTEGRQFSAYRMEEFIERFGRKEYAEALNKANL